MTFQRIHNTQLFIEADGGLYSATGVHKHVNERWIRGHRQLNIARHVWVSVHQLVAEAHLPFRPSANSVAYLIKDPRHDIRHAYDPTLGNLSWHKSVPEHLQYTLHDTLSGTTIALPPNMYRFLKHHILTQHLNKPITVEIRPNPTYIPPVQAE